MLNDSMRGQKYAKAFYQQIGVSVFLQFQTRIPSASAASASLESAVIRTVDELFTKKEYFPFLIVASCNASERSRLYFLANFSTKM